MRSIHSLLIFVVLFADVVSAVDLQAITPNNEGVKILEGDNKSGAQKKFLEAIEADSFDPHLRINLGIGYLVNKDPKNAVNEFRVAEKMAGEDSQIKFAARFNMGVAFAQAEDIDAALAAYQSALELQPDSKEVKTNIELLWKQGKGKGKGSKGNKDKEKDKEGGGESEGDKENSDKSEGEVVSSRPMPRTYQNEQLTEETVNKVLEELKAQEQRVRGEHYGQSKKERAREKNW